MVSEYNSDDESISNPKTPSPTTSTSMVDPHHSAIVVTIAVEFASQPGTTVFSSSSPTFDSFNRLISLNISHIQHIANKQIVSFAKVTHKPQAIINPMAKILYSIGYNQRRLSRGCWKICGVQGHLARRCRLLPNGPLSPLYLPMWCACLSPTTMAFTFWWLT
ncbi:Uncharacterized protein Fot_33163 [Forsythia ovata]|uniref:CCHC-type domain-containing protein n=1 Tax=Forsythia ovata TaxID=205694 RepID=A0ABD1TA38_9LAMI